MNNYHCTLLRSQYQTVEVQAEDYEQAEAIAKGMFDELRINAEFIEIYDIVETEEEYKQEVNK